MKELSIEDLIEKHSDALCILLTIMLSRSFFSYIEKGLVGVFNDNNLLDPKGNIVLETLIEGISLNFIICGDS